MRLHDLGVRDDRLAPRKRKQIPETLMDRRKKEKNTLERKRLRKKMRDPLYRTRLEENRKKRAEEKKRKEVLATEAALNLTGTRIRKTTKKFGQ